MESSREGQRLGGKYLLVKLLGAGGMGEVYQAENELIGRKVAIKVMRPEVAKDSALVERFLREARAANILRHPNVVDVLDVGEEGGVPFIVQELLSGEDLANFTEKRGGKLPVDLMLRHILPVVDAVALAHSKGVAHRDLKPENVFLAREDSKVVPKLLDFGVSRIEAAGSKLTATGMMLGTPAYMAPEQVYGQGAARAADVWALGVIMHELVSGVLPFKAETQMELFMQITTGTPTPLEEAAPHAPAELGRVVAKCLKRDPNERYADTYELLKELKVVAKTVRDAGRYAARDSNPGLGAVRGEAGAPPPAAASTNPAAPVVISSDRGAQAGAATIAAIAAPQETSEVVGPALRGGATAEIPDLVIAPKRSATQTTPRPASGPRLVVSGDNGATAPIPGHGTTPIPRAAPHSGTTPRAEPTTPRRLQLDSSGYSGPSSVRQTAVARPPPSPLENENASSASNGAAMAYAIWVIAIGLGAGVGRGIYAAADGETLIGQVASLHALAPKGAAAAGAIFALSLAWAGLELLRGQNVPAGATRSAIAGALVSIAFLFYVYGSGG